MLETSKDLLYIVIAFSVLWLSIFVSWMVYYLAMILREGYVIFRDFRKKLDKVDELLAHLKEKLEKSSSHLVLLLGAVKQLVGYFETKKAKKAGSTKTKQTKE